MAKKLIVGENDLETANPEVAKTLHPTLNGNITARDITANSHKKLWWICEHGHVWEAMVANRNKGTGCPVCAGKIVITGVNDFGSKHLELVPEWDEKKNKGISPFEVAEYSNRKFHWKKMLRSPITGRMRVARWEDTIAHRVQGRGCPYESGQKVLRGYNDFPSFASPEIMAEWDYEKNGELDPYSLTYGSNQKVWWKCKKGHSWYASIDSRIRKHTGCPTCNESHGEKEISLILTKFRIPFKREYKFEDCYFQNSSQRLRLDFALMSGNTVIGAIEYHGEQHYHPVDFGGKGMEVAMAACKITQKRDAAKTEYLSKKGVPQLIIPYTEFCNIEKLVSEFIEKSIIHGEYLMAA